MTDLAHESILLPPDTDPTHDTRGRPVARDPATALDEQGEPTF